MYELVRLPEMKRHLRLPPAVTSPLSDDDQDLQDKLDEAHALVLDYVNQRRAPSTSETVAETSPPEVPWADQVAGWTEDTAPFQVRLAIKIQCAEIWRFRGDDEKGPDTMLGLSSPVRRCLDRLRDFGVA